MSDALNYFLLGVVCTVPWSMYFGEKYRPSVLDETASRFASALYEISNKLKSNANFSGCKAHINFDFNGVAVTLVADPNKSEIAEPKRTNGDA